MAQQVATCVANDEHPHLNVDNLENHGQRKHLQLHFAFLNEITSYSLPDILEEDSLKPTDHYLLLLVTIWTLLKE